MKDILKIFFQIFLLKFDIDDNVIRKHNFIYYFLFSMKSFIFKTKFSTL